MKRVISLLMAAALTCLLLGGCKKEAAVPLRIFSGSDLQMLTADSISDLRKDARWAYWEIAVAEAVQILAAQTGVTAEEAQKTLLTGGYTLYTAFDQSAYNALRAAYEAQGGGLQAGIALTDLEGKLLAVCSSNGSTNYAAAPAAPYSALKPLSVYAQAFEKDLIQWNSFYEDSPYKKVENEDGIQENWPVNPTKQYLGKQVNIAYAVSRSLNTVAVKCLADVGVENSMEFLSQKLGIDLDIEKYTAQIYGTEEVIGNIALGYLDAGVSPVNMAGYYQMFANGGKYQVPAAVRKLCGPDGTVLYERSYDPEQVIRPVTAQLMNQLLQQVVTVGTGRDAACGNIQVAGKTGTGDDNSGNWFVGVTPAYSCAVWHGKAEENRADAIFAAAVRNLYAAQPGANRNFVTYANLQQIVCCAESGAPIGDKCTVIEVCYFVPETQLKTCQAHG